MIGTVRVLCKHKSSRRLKATIAVLLVSTIASAVRQRKLEEDVYRLSLRVKKLDRSKEE